MDVQAVVKEIGLGILRPFRVSAQVAAPTRPSYYHAQDEPISRSEFLTKWGKAVGDTFEASISLDLLSVNASLNMYRVVHH